MGIIGIYGEIGPGERIALSKLAIQKFEETGRPLRVAIDISIWQFQVQSGQGGSNPAVRTFYYRLLRLLSLSVQPLFVFDGPHKPPFKRNKRTGQNVATIPNMLMKQLIKLFGFPLHIAPGEAEAECALLQREGIVDAVLSEDVDTLMFGCGITLRNWSSEGKRGGKTPTHVSLYDSHATLSGKAGLDREGMILVALMSGGDYLPAGIPKCGIKVACEAARGGFGKSLCSITRSDKAAMDGWRENLIHELHTNESKLFRSKHPAIKVPSEFPDKEVLSYYTHPVVSSASKIESMKDGTLWDGDLDVNGLREFVAEAFDWTHRHGAVKFIRTISPALLIKQLRMRGEGEISSSDPEQTAVEEMKLVKSIGSRRIHFSTDGMTELRVVYHPIEITGIDLDSEPDRREEYGRDGLAPLNKENELIEAYQSDVSASGSVSPTKRKTAAYDPTQPDKLWVSEIMLKFGVPLMTEDYEAALRNPKKASKKKSTSPSRGRRAPNGGMPKGAIEPYLRVTKSGTNDLSLSKGISRLDEHSTPDLPPPFLAPMLAKSASQPIQKSQTGRKQPESLHPTRSQPVARVTKVVKKPGSTTRGTAQPSVRSHANPWTTLNDSQTPVLTAASITKPLSSQPSAKPPCRRDDASISVSAPARPRPPPDTETFTDEMDSELDDLGSILDHMSEEFTQSQLPPNPRPSTPQPETHTPIITLSSSPPPAPSLPAPPPQLTKKRYMMPRASLPGTWKELEVEVDGDGDGVPLGSEGVRTSKRDPARRWRLSEVEVLDLVDLVDEE